MPDYSLSMRRLVLLPALALLTSFWLALPALAQPSEAEMKQRMAAQTDTLVQTLALTADQEEPVRTILEENNTKRMELRNKARESGSFMGLREDMAALNEETVAKLGEVLTEEQMAAYHKFMEEQRSQRRGRRPGGF